MNSLPTIRSLLLFATALLPGLLCGAADSPPLIQDSVDALGSGSWQRVAGKWSAIGNRFIETQGELRATAGGNFWSGANTGDAPAARGIARYFPGKVIAPGTWTVSFDVGCFDDLTFPENRFVISLLSDTNKDATYDWSERLPPSEINIVADPAPPPGQWKRWTCTFYITENTKTAKGESVIGTPLGFMILATVRGGSGYAFDNLTITHTAPK
ncbi:hypothetical protein OPIT5_09315 [Opitutaceae bacterium TAV5]|nr:hypothetical protein OPIT5_09315 [Opitutaceae bacterium TAV5]